MRFNMVINNACNTTASECPARTTVRSTHLQKLSVPHRLVDAAAQHSLCLCGSSVFASLLRGIVPGAITLSSLFSGFGAILYAGSRLFIPACLAIGASVVLDSLDGWAARRLRVTSRAGMEMDSLADIVAFGIAPAVLMVQWSFPAGGGALCLLAALVYL